MSASSATTTPWSAPWRRGCAASPPESDATTNGEAVSAREGWQYVVDGRGLLGRVAVVIADEILNHGVPYDLPLATFFAPPLATTPPIAAPTVPHTVQRLHVSRLAYDVVDEVVGQRGPLEEVGKGRAVGRADLGLRELLAAEGEAAGVLEVAAGLKERGALRLTGVEQCLRLDLELVDGLVDADVGAVVPEGVLHHVRDLLEAEHRDGQDRRDHDVPPHAVPQVDAQRVGDDEGHQQDLAQLDVRQREGEEDHLVHLLEGLRRSATVHLVQVQDPLRVAPRPAQRLQQGGAQELHDHRRHRAATGVLAVAARKDRPCVRPRFDVLVDVDLKDRLAAGPTAHLRLEEP
mmetsp:Transcript_52928/g.148522  ORF Transcript_52928/g.148522 Transcript_52928/m.148522 type:complete len:348 (+) Transcript_52928:123-1166(+)